MKTSKIIADLREENGWSQGYLASKTGIYQVIVCKYAKDDAIPSMEEGKKIADAFGVSLDFLVGEGQNAHLDKKTLKRIEELNLFDNDKRRTLFDLMDTHIRDAKTRAAYVS